MRKFLALKCSVVLLAVAMMLLLVTGCQKSGTASSPGTVITDFDQRSVTVPATVNRVLGLHPVSTYAVWRLAPDKLTSVDWVFQWMYLQATSTKYLSDADIAKLNKLPVTGTFFAKMNTEQVISLKPDVIVTLDSDINVDKLQQQAKIPVVAVAKEPLSAYEDTFRMVGKIVGNEADADKLAAFWDKTLKTAQAATAQAPDNKKLRVFYTGKLGDVLTTAGKDTVMGSVIDTAGGINLGDQLSDTGNESATVSIEQILAWNPDLIIVATEGGKQQIMSDPRYKNLTAVKDGKVYVPPQYGDLDSVQSIMGLVWAQGLLLHGNDAASQAYLAQEMKAYYPLFFNRTITDQQIKQPCTQL